MTGHLVVGADEIIEQLLIQCWLFEALAGDRAAARRQAERTLERLLSQGLPHATGTSGLRLDPYAAANWIKCRAGELTDEAWQAWQSTTRRNAVSLPREPCQYEFSMQREWHSYTVTPGRPVILRLPLPLRGAELGPAEIQLLEPHGARVDIRALGDRVELRLDPPAAAGPIIARMRVAFVAGDLVDSGSPAALPDSAVSGDDSLWLRDREGLVVQSAAVTALAANLAQQCADHRQFVHAAWRWLMQQLRFGDVHRGALDPDDPLGGLLTTRRADCALGSSLLIALCRARGIPARLLSGYLLHPANPGPHAWAEVRLAQDLWVPVDFGSWCYCAGNADDPDWGSFYLGRVDARFVAEIAPRQFTGWGSAPPPAQWYRLERLDGQAIEHTLHALPDNTLFRRDRLTVTMKSDTVPPPGLAL